MLASTDQPRMGFFTDTSVCIGCKACEVACKEWNQVPESRFELTGWSYDNTKQLDADNWRHVAFVEKSVAVPDGDVSPGVGQAAAHEDGFRWLMSSDVCKHCTRAACLEVCPTGSLFRTEYGTVVVQEDICNGCGYCVPACPFGVLDQREDDGRVWKCTLCYDRLQDEMVPACAQACPTESIQYGEVDDLRVRAADRLSFLQDAGVGDARLYGGDDDDGVEGMGAFFLLLDEPEVYGLPPDPVVTTRDLPSMWRSAAVAGAALVGMVTTALIGSRRG